MAINEKKLNKRSEREKSFKISGIKMFNPELTPSGGQYSHRNSTSKEVKLIGDTKRKSVQKKSSAFLAIGLGLRASDSKE